MKRAVFIFYLSVLNTAICIAQNFSEIGEISAEEIRLSKCAFDPEANSIILVHEAFSDYDEQYHLITRHHVRIKILNEKGINEANITIPFYRKGDFEIISKVEGVTVNVEPDGTIKKTRLDKKTVYTKQINERIGEVAFAFPEVREGSIIDYKYRSTMENYYGLEYWYFQEDKPVLLSKYTVVILPNIEFAYRLNKRSDRAVIITQDPNRGSTYFEMQNIPGLRDEPYMDAKKDYLQKVIFQLSGYIGNEYDKKKYMTSWEELNNELLNSENFGAQLKKSLGADELLDKVRQLSTPEEKMRTVYYYVQKNMVWNNLYSKFAMDGIKDPWRKKTGTSGEINLILVNLLCEAGLNAYPVLVSERFHGKVNTDYPFLDQFNSVFAVAEINSKNYYMDATDKFCPPDIIPYDILGTTGYMVMKKTGQLVKITNDSLQYKENVNVFMEVQEDGTVRGSLKAVSSDYARVEKMRAFRNSKKELQDHFFYAEGLSVNVTSHEIKNADNNSLPFEQEFEFQSMLNSSGDYKYLPLNFLPGFRRNPFLSNNRFSNINFGYKKNLALVVTIALPANFKVDSITKSVRMLNQDKDILFVRQLTYDKASNTANLIMNLEFTRSLYMANEYPMLKEFYKKIFDYLKEPLLLMKR